MLEEKSGLELYRLFLSGDDSAAERLLETYSDALVRFAYCYVKDFAVAEDIMEDAFATLLIRRRHFSDNDNFRAYLYKVVRNKSIDHLRANRRCVALESVSEPSSDSTEEAFFGQERKRALYRGLQAIPRQYGEVLYLVYIEEYAIAETCKIMKKSQKQVYNLLARAKNALKEELAKEGVRYEDL